MVSSRFTPSPVLAADLADLTLPCSSDKWYPEIPHVIPRSSNAAAASLLSPSLRHCLFYFLYWSPPDLLAKPQSCWHDLVHVLTSRRISCRDSRY